MIIGIGADLIYVERIRRSIHRFGQTWLDHLFSCEEQQLYCVAFDQAEFFARAFCGKEACAKALGTGLADGVDWRDIMVLQADSGTSLRLAGDALKRLDKLTPRNHIAQILVACMSNRQLAQAFVVLSTNTP